MASTAETFARIDALIRVALRVVGQSPSGRIGLARAAAAIELEWIPRPWGDPIATALSEAAARPPEPLRPKEVERILREAWDEPPGSELDDFDPEPVAVTPGAQVHRAIHDGVDVAVKVLRPGLAASVRSDLALLEALTAPLTAAFPALDAGAVLREIRERVMEELDFEHEAQVQRRFHRALRGHPHLTVPAPVTRLAADSVLVSEWVDGVPLAQAPDVDAAAAALITFVVGGARFRLMHADPKPDDLLVMADGRLAVLDFGATRTVSSDRAEAFAAVVEAFAAGDGDAFGAGLDELGALPASYGPDALSLIAGALGELGEPGPSRLDSEAVIAARDRLLDRVDLLAALIPVFRAAPEDLWPLRGVAIAFATVARAGASGDWLELTRAAVRDGWDALG